ncbi:hypothetical protein C0995_001524 [Termitomyces sp. Mi166|nr:hypothetical protein C0995_001524 [Termitomyces sp. Mi166\
MQASQRSSPSERLHLYLVGGIGVIGGVRQSPKFLQGSIDELKSNLEDKNAPFGVDLLIPQRDYTEGQLPELIDVIIRSKASLFVCAVGVPPKWAVDKLHTAGIPIMNMIGHPKHVPKALAQGVDIICAQGGEGGGHTGDTAFSILIPAVVDACKGKTSPLTGEPIIVVAAGGIADGRGLAASLVYGASGVWVGTRFVASLEAGAPKKHKEMVLTAGYDDVTRTLIYSGRPMSVRKTPYVADWESNRRAEMDALLAEGKVPHEIELQNHPNKSIPGFAWLMGRVAGSINDIKPAKEIFGKLHVKPPQHAKLCKIMWCSLEDFDVAKVKAPFDGNVTSTWRDEKTEMYGLHAVVSCSAIGWRLQGQGKALHEIHEPVPDYK